MKSFLKINEGFDIYLILDRKEPHDKVGFGKGELLFPDLFIFFLIFISECMFDPDKHIYVRAIKSFKPTYIFLSIEYFVILIS